MQTMSPQQEAVKSPLFRLKPERALRRRAFLEWGICVRARRFLSRWRCMRGILASAWESFRGHLGILSAREELAIDLGPAFERDASGCLRENTRTVVRNQCIEKLLALHPWSDPVDLETFLLGFDAGEQYAYCGKGKRTW